MSTTGLVVAASFINLLYWGAFIAIVVYLLYLVDAERQRRARIHRLRQLRRHMDSLEPKRWTR